MVPILTPFFHLFNSIGFSFYQLFLSVVGDLSVNGATFGKLGGSREAECWCESGMSSRKSGDGRWESSYLEVATLTLKSSKYSKRIEHEKLCQRLLFYNLKQSKKCQSTIVLFTKTKIAIQARKPLLVGIIQGCKKINGIITVF